jgi:hypothetical protein
LAVLEPHLVIDPGKVPNRENLQNAAHRAHDKKTERWEKRVELYDTHNCNLCTLIARKCKQDLDKLENLPDNMEFSFNNPLRLLQAIRHECVTFEEEEWPTATIVHIMLEALTLSQLEGESKTKLQRSFNLGCISNEHSSRYRRTRLAPK